ncbi:dTDP-4-dehydrorhamnose reductase [Polynucleobacter antarcticus]|uniref:dTDP-4-dehydrorhamnose reductase n=1 Tax=Polynucleobacter antarcticus TaxID=1743162 RepID=A0A6M9PVD4_9BURK|nr:dTDP-4-dehydrorhamnose reductase [Polynucleobacter antarcticus]QKM61886.1 dTDP-4-dehydrorhamnose reductase [Polynucleobacter antarcticus]
MNILVFGKDGQLGKAFKAVFTANTLEAQHHIDYVGRAECDLASSQAVKTVLDQLKPDLIINAAAYTAVDKAETEVDLAFAINATAPEIMAQYAVANNATFLHYSTDYVFDGSKDGVYTEEDLRNPLGVYGKSKAAGEVAIEDMFANLPLDSKAQFAILRTSWVYGDGGNFIRTILRLAKEREQLSIISDQHGVPTSAEWLSSVSLNLVLNAEGQIKPFPSGIYHAVPSGETTWHGLATLAVQSAIEAGIVMRVKPESIKPILAVDYPLPAPRPMNSRMATDRLQSVLKRSGDELIQVQLAQLLEPWDKPVKTYVRHLVHSKLIT